MIKYTSDNTFESDVINSKTPVLLDFYADWCGPCKQLSPTLEQIANELQNQVIVYKCNVDDNPETPSKLMVRGIPSLMIFKDGKLVDSKVGALPKPALTEWVKKTLAL
jgi:thioredoxin 1